MEHKFYLKPESEQKNYILKVTAATFLMVAALVITAVISGIYLLILPAPLILLIAAPFIDTPRGKRNGTLIYHSPMFLSEPEKNNRVIVHGGTLFDYVFTLDSNMSSKERTRAILSGYIEGLIHFIEEHEKQGNIDLKVRGTSYIINRRTAQRIGFQPVTTDFIQFMIIFLNYVPITLSNCYSKKKIDFPKLSRIVTYEADFQDLMARKGDLNELKKCFDIVDQKKRN